MTVVLERPGMASVWFPNHAMVQSLFSKAEDLTSDVRRFLNCFNKGMGEQRQVFSLGAAACQVMFYNVTGSLFTVRLSLLLL